MRHKDTDGRDTAGAVPLAACPDVQVSCTPDTAVVPDGGSGGRA